MDIGRFHIRKQIAVTNLIVSQEPVLNETTKKENFIYSLECTTTKIYKESQIRSR